MEKEIINTDIEKLKYPVGKFIKPDIFTKQQISDWITIIEQLPSKLRKEVEHLSDEQLDTPYRPDGWTVRQVVHHLGDSHMNSYLRFHWTLTEDKPTIKPYFEDRWAELPDTKFAPIEMSLNLIAALHFRWVYSLKLMNENDFNKIYIHPEYGKEFDLKTALGSYAWHCDHHLAHITELKKRMGW